MLYFLQLEIQEIQFLIAIHFNIHTVLFKFLETYSLIFNTSNVQYVLHTMIAKL